MAMPSLKSISRKGVPVRVRVGGPILGHTMFHQSKGTLHYSIAKVKSLEDPKVWIDSYRLAVLIDPGISLFYRSLIPKYYNVKPQMHDPHISVVRYENPPNMDFWGVYEGEMIKFLYDPIIQNDVTYWWLNVFCKRLEEIRLELGLPVSSPFTRPPDGFDKVFHTTIGNCKKL